MARSRKLTLTYIEETPKHHKRLVTVAARGVKNGIASAKKAGFYITYARGSEIVREHPNGRVEVIGKLDHAPLKVEKDARFTLG